MVSEVGVRGDRALEAPMNAGNRRTPPPRRPGSGSSWDPVASVELGMTARVLIVEKGGERYAVKVPREQGRDPLALRVEHRVLKYLNKTPMRGYIPQVGEWLLEGGGFAMTYLRYPTEAEKAGTTWIPSLARALRTLHRVDLPTIEGLPDDRPDVGAALVGRLRGVFKAVLKENGFWAGLSAEDRRRLETVRAHYGAYAAVLFQAAELLADAPVALTHGDLAGDNLMVTQDGDLAIVDWGSARIGAALTDPASLSVYMGWSPEERRRFHHVYLEETEGSEETLPTLEILAQLHRYRSCVQSLLWLNGDPEGLDAVGRRFFEAQLHGL